MQQIPFIDLFKPALHVSGDKLTHPQEHFFFTVYTALVQCTDIAADRCIVPKAVYNQKVLLRMGEFVARNM